MKVSLLTNASSLVKKNINKKEGTDVAPNDVTQPKKKVKNIDVVRPVHGASFQSRLAAPNRDVETTLFFIQAVCAPHSLTRYNIEKIPPDIRRKNRLGSVSLMEQKAGHIVNYLPPIPGSFFTFPR